MNLKYIGIGVIVAILLIITVIFVAFYSVGSEWSTTWNDNADVSGTWGEDITIIYDDGSTDSLKLLVDRNWPLVVEYQGREITAIQYRIYGMATGEEFTTCNVDVTSFAVHARITAPDGDPVYIKDYQYHEPWYLTVNGDTEILCDALVDVDELTGWSSGAYTVSFTPSGSVRYRGENSYISDWYTTAIPPGRSLIVDNVVGTITLNLADTIDYYIA